MIYLHAIVHRNYAYIVRLDACLVTKRRKNTSILYDGIVFHQKYICNIKYTSFIDVSTVSRPAAARATTTTHYLHSGPKQTHHHCLLQLNNNKERVAVSRKNFPDEQRSRSALDCVHLQLRLNYASRNNVL